MYFRPIDVPIPVFDLCFRHLWGRCLCSHLASQLFKSFHAFCIEASGKLMNSECKPHTLEKQKLSIGLFLCSLQCIKF
uniref:Uncharacterized protein n=1 Tax=Arundo donax TaxID=35708 RepID=A0A0A9DK71_ARUDO